MTLAELRKLAIRKQIQIRFPLRNGMECVVNEQGVAQVPALKGVPDFNLEDEAGAASEFLVHSIDRDKKGVKRPSAEPRRVSPEELTRMVSTAPGAAAAADHEED